MRSNGGLDYARDEKEAVMIAKNRKYWRKVDRREAKEAKAKAAITLPSISFLRASDDKK